MGTRGRFGGISHPFGTTGKLIKQKLLKKGREEVNIDTTGKLRSILEEAHKEKKEGDEQ